MADVNLKRGMAHLVAALLLLATVQQVSAQSVRTAEYQTGDGNRTAIIVDHGRNRPAPVVVVLHGALGTSEQIRRYMAWDEVAAREGLIVVYPQGVANSWNDGRPPDARRFNPASRVDDVGFIRRIVGELNVAGKVDRQRVFITGLSNGGHLTYRLICEANDLFAAGAAIIANLSVMWTRSCGGRPIPVLVMSGTEDRISPWEGQARPGDAGGLTLSALETFAFFRARNGCTGAGEKPLARQGASDNTRVVLMDGTGCRHATSLYRIEGGGHQAPARAGRTMRPLVGAMLGQQNHDIEAAEEIWAFFKERARPATP